MDFENDMKCELLRLAKENYFKISLKEDLSEMLLDYLTVYTKLIPQKRRAI